MRGVPIAVKDLIDVAAGLRPPGAYRDNVADRHAPVAAALDVAGAVAMAVANLHELGAGATGIVSWFGPTCNPWDPDRIVGGSSSRCHSQAADWRGRRRAAAALHNPSLVPFHPELPAATDDVDDPMGAGLIGGPSRECARHLAPARRVHWPRRSAVEHLVNTRGGCHDRPRDQRMPWR